MGQLAVVDEGAEPVGVRDRYGLVLIAIIAQLLVAALLTGSTAGQFALLVANGVTLLVVYRVSHVHGRVWSGLVALVVIGAVLGATALVAPLDANAASRVLNAFSLVFIAASPYVVARRLLKHGRITGSTMMGALSLYLLIGQLFAVLFAIIALSTSEPFFVSADPARFVDFLYFSFVTLTTLGYGDLVPATDIGRMAAVTEALIGQLYLVSVVALVVGNLGRNVASGAKRADGEQEAK